MKDPIDDLLRRRRCGCAQCVPDHVARRPFIDINSVDGQMKATNLVVIGCIVLSTLLGVFEMLAPKKKKENDA